MHTLRKQSIWQILSVLTLLGLVLFMPSHGVLDEPSSYQRVGPSHGPDGAGATVILDVWASLVPAGAPTPCFNPGDEFWGNVLFDHPGGPVEDDFVLKRVGGGKLGPIAHIEAPNLGAARYTLSVLVATVPDNLANVFELEMANRHLGPDTPPGGIITIGDPFTAEPAP